MSKRSAGLLMFREADGACQVLLVHPGGPFWARRDDGAWSLPKGLVEAGEDPLAAARREVFEEIGATPEGDCEWLGEYRQPGGKRVLAWSVEGDLDVAHIVSNTVRMEWPRKSGRMMEFPEIDRAGWFTLEEAARKILPGQRPILADFAKLLRRQRPAVPHG